MTSLRTTLFSAYVIIPRFGQRHIEVTFNGNQGEGDNKQYSLEDIRQGIIEHFILHLSLK